MTPLGPDDFRSAGAPSALQLRSRRSLRHNSHLSAKRAIYQPNRFYLANGPPFILIIVLCDFPLNWLYVQVCTKKWDGHVLVIRVPLNSAGRRQGLISVVLCNIPLNLLYGTGLHQKYDGHVLVVRVPPLTNPAHAILLRFRTHRCSSQNVAPTFPLQMGSFDFYETFLCYRGCLNLNCYIGKKVQKNFLMGLKIW